MYSISNGSFRFQVKRLNHLLSFEVERKIQFGRKHKKMIQKKTKKISLTITGSNNDVKQLPLTAYTTSNNTNQPMNQPTIPQNTFGCD